MKDKVLIDTSVWIAYLQGTSAGNLSRTVDDILATREVCVPKIVVAELIQGARSEKDVAVIREFLDAFTIIGEGPDSWVAAGNLSFSLKRKGKSVNLADCCIALQAMEHDCSILSLDRHFRDIQGSAAIDLLAHDARSDSPA